MANVTERIELHGRNYSSLSGNRSISDNGLYVPFVAEAASNPNVFATFKSSPIYTEVLEHVSEALGSQYLDVIARENPQYLSKIEAIKLNDAIGKPLLGSYNGIGDISPTTLRYMKVASDLHKYFGDNFKTIAEIGVGYGGQMLIIDKLFDIYQYSLFDLPPVLNLVSRYLESHQLNSSYRCLTINQSSGGERYDLAISNYAFSELPSSLQKLYIRKILLNSQRGYLTMNSGLPNSTYKEDKLTLADLKDFLPSFEVADEHPLTSEGNYIMVWGHR